MDEFEALAKLAARRVAYLATIRPDNTPHIVPITFVVAEGAVLTAIDHKPKRTTRLQRLANIESNPTVSILGDDYSDDWRRLWWVRVDGIAEIHEDDEIREEWLIKLAEKYGQYVDHPPAGPVIAVAITAVISWESTP